MADKLTQQITDALSRAAAEPGGTLLYASKAEIGLFPNTSAAKPAAQKCLADDLLRAVGTDAQGKAARDRYCLTEKGWEFLLAAVNPKQVLEDFVRVLEARQGEVGELLVSARRMADNLQGIKDAVARVLPGVSAAKVERPRSEAPPRSPPCGEGGNHRLAFCAPDPHPSSEGAPSPSRRGGDPGVDLLDDLAPAICAYLAGRAGATDCPLPELFRALAPAEAPTIGRFHDCLRQLHADGTVTLPAWTGPLYALPEPQFALLIGHGIAYYASLRG